MPPIGASQTGRRSPSRSSHARASLVAAVAAALVLVADARSHVTASPTFVESGAPTTVAFETPNERAPHATTSLELQAPAGFELEAAGPPPGWSVVVRGDTVRWSGGRIEDESLVAFSVVVTARTAPGSETFRARQGYDDGESVEWSTTLTVLPAETVDAPSQRFGRALAGGAVGLALIAGSLLVVRRLRRRPPA